jgi:tRNA-modifying protein YgfZ
MTGQLRSLEGVFFDLSARAKLRVIGADRFRFLNGQLTNDIRKATETNAIEACVLNARGKMEGHLFFHLQADSFLLDADPELKSSLTARLERYIIADDVQIENVTDQLSIFHTIGASPPAVSAPARLVSADRFGVSGHDIWIDANQHDQVASELADEFDFWDEDCTEVFRIEHGIPKWGRELTNEIIPVEANLEQRCIDYEKGCYIGQEIISRMKMSGQRNKQLCGLISLSETALVPGTKLTLDGKEVGWITSAARSQHRKIALGYVKRGFNAIGTKLEALSAENTPVAVEVTDLQLLYRWPM